MSQQLLKEYFPIKLSPSQLNEAVREAGKPMILKKVLIQRSGAKNRNGRIYPKEVLEREVDRYIDEMVNNNRALGELDHADSNVVNLKNVSHNLKNVYWDGDDLYADIEILDDPDFPSGRIAGGLLRRNIPVGISSRALGSVTKINEDTVQVDDDLALICWDLVSFESTQGANMSLMEGFNPNNIETESRIDEILRDIICNNSGACSCKFHKK